MDFIEKYFIAPIYNPAGTYNFVNTITYAAIAFAVLFGIYKILKRLDFTIDNKFFYASFPFIILGSSLRAFVDSGIYEISFWTVSPGIYILTAGLFFGFFFFSLLLEKLGRLDYWKTLTSAGMIILGAHFGLVARNIHATNLGFALAVAGLATLASVLLLVAFRLANFKAGRKYFLPFPAHMLDAAATFMAVDFLGAAEKHPLPSLFSNFVGTAAVMFLLKLAVLVPLVYFLDKEFEDKNLVKYLIIAVAVLGFAEGIRDLLAIAIV